MALSKADILKAEDFEIEKVAVPEWGGDVCVRSMTARERDRLEAELLKWRQAGNTDINFRARLCVKTVCDENGKLLFTEKDADELGKKSAKALDRILPVAQKLNGLTDQDVEQLEKNSETAR